MTFYDCFLQSLLTTSDSSRHLPLRRYCKLILTPFFSPTHTYSPLARLHRYPLLNGQLCRPHQRAYPRLRRLSRRLHCRRCRHLHWLPLRLSSSHCIHRIWRRHLRRRHDWYHRHGDRPLLLHLPLLRAHLRLNPTLGNRMHPHHRRKHDDEGRSRHQLVVPWRRDSRVHNDYGHAVYVLYRVRSHCGDHHIYRPECGGVGAQEGFWRTDRAVW